MFPWKEQLYISPYWKQSTASIVLIIRGKLNSLCGLQGCLPGSCSCHFSLFSLLQLYCLFLPLINSCFSLPMGLCLCYFHHLEFLFHLSLPTELLLIFPLLAQISILSMKLNLCLRLGKITFYWTKYFWNTYIQLYIYLHDYLMPFSQS